MIATKFRFGRFVSAMIAAVLMFCCMFSVPLTTSADEEDTVVRKAELAKEMVVLLNEARAEQGLKPVYLVPYLCDVANVRARECIFYFSHERPDGSKFSSALDTSLVPYWTCAENIAAGYDTSVDTFRQWQQSAKHNEAMMNPVYTHIGIGVCYEPNSDYGWYWEMFLVELPEGQELQGQEIPRRYEVVPQCEGDLNGDGVVNNFDLILFKQYMSGMVSFNDLQIKAADLLVDGMLTYADVRVLQKYILGEYKSLPVKI